MINRSSRMMSKALLLLVLLGLPTVASAEPYETIANNGSPLNRVDIAILGDGYTAGEMQKYRAEVQQFLQGWFAQEPYSEYQRYYNVHRIDVISSQSGADHPERTPPVFVDTALDATYNCAGIQRLICVNTSKVATVVSNSLPPSHRDVVLIIVNDPEYGGSGGSVAVASTHFWAVELILHEVGHSFGLLADEYVGGGSSCNPNIEPSEVNATRETVRELVKWNHWIDPLTPIPTTSTTPSVPGLYRGAKYCDVGLYRPTYDSKMQTLGQPFEQINTEQHVKRIYNFVSPLDSSEPTENNVTIMQGHGETFSVTTPRPLTHTLNVTWFVDGQSRGSGGAFNLDSSTLSPGSHTVEALVSDETPLVRSDPQQLLSERRSWNVTIVALPSVVDFRLLGPSGEVLAELHNGATLDAATLAQYSSLVIEAVTNPPTVGSVRMNADFDNHVENGAPYTTNSFSIGRGAATDLTLGQHSLISTPYTLPNSAGTAGTSESLAFIVIDTRSTMPSVVEFKLRKPSGELLATLQDGAVLDAATLAQYNGLVIEAVTNPSVVGSVHIEADFDNHNENGAPYTTSSFTVGRGADSDLALGQHSLTATPYTGPNATGLAGTTRSLSFTVTDARTPAPSVIGFRLRGPSGEVLAELQDGAVLDAATLTQYSGLVIEAVTSPAVVGSVHINADFDNHVENGAPYTTMFFTVGRGEGIDLAVGQYTLMATPYTGPNATGTAGVARSLVFNITNSSSSLW